LRWFVLKHVKDYHDGEDILQDIFFKIHSNIQSLKNMDKLDAWVYQVARNTITDYYRRKQKCTLETTLEYKGEADQGVPENASGSPVSCIRPIIDSLPEKYRQAIIMTEYGGLTQKEMAEKLGLSVSGTKSRVQRAREMLKKKLLECCHFEFDRLGNVIDYHHKMNNCPFCD